MLLLLCLYDKITRVNEALADIFAPFARLDLTEKENFNHLPTGRVYFSVKFSLVKGAIISAIIFSFK